MGDKMSLTQEQIAKELGIKEVLCDIRSYDNEQQEIKDLIETNIRQRGDISSSSLKMGRIIKTLEDIYKIKNGGDRTSLTNGQSATQEDIAKQLGIDKGAYIRDKKLLDFIPELQDMFIEGKLTTSVASRILARLSPTEQSQLIEELGKDKIVNDTKANRE